MRLSLIHIYVYTKPYEGIPELVAEIARRGIRIAVASNKFQAGTEKLIRLFFPGVEFAAVFGQREGVPLKPDPAVVGEILALTGVAKERVIYVGDSGDVYKRQQQVYPEDDLLPAGSLSARNPVVNLSLIHI